MKVKPIRDNVIIKQFDKVTQSAGGIVIPDGVGEKPCQGKVVAVGTGKILSNGVKLKMDVRVGDVVLFTKFKGSDVKINGEDFVIMKEDQIMAILG